MAQAPELTVVVFRSATPTSSWRTGTCWPTGPASPRCGRPPPASTRSPTTCTGSGRFPPSPSPSPSSTVAPVTPAASSPWRPTSASPDRAPSSASSRSASDPFPEETQRPAAPPGGPRVRPGDPARRRRLPRRPRGGVRLRQPCPVGRRTGAVRRRLRPAHRGLRQATITRTKALVDAESLPAEESYNASLQAVFQTSGRPTWHSPRTSARWSPSGLELIPGGHFSPYLEEFDAASSAAVGWFTQHLS